MGLYHSFNAACNEVPLGKDIEHPRSLSHAIAWSRDIEFSGCPSGSPDSLLDSFGKGLQWKVTWIDVRPRIDDSDERPV
jgi:hypothetical protein